MDITDLYLTTKRVSHVDNNIRIETHRFLLHKHINIRELSWLPWVVIMKTRGATKDNEVFQCNHQREELTV